MPRRNPGRARGFTLIEVLVVVTIISIVAALMIPNLLDALQKAKQKRTLGSIRDVGTAWFSWLTDESSAAAAGQSQGPNLFSYANLTTIDVNDLTELLMPQDGVRYAASVPPRDQWANPLHYATAADPRTATNAIAIRSFGRDGEEGPTMAPYPMGSYQITRYEEDIVWSDGFFVRYPAGVLDSL